MAEQAVGACSARPSLNDYRGSRTGSATRGAAPPPISLGRGPPGTSAGRTAEGGTAFIVYREFFLACNSREKTQEERSTPLVPK